MTNIATAEASLKKAETEYRRAKLIYANEMKPARTATLIAIGVSAFLIGLFCVIGIAIHPAYFLATCGCAIVGGGAIAAAAFPYFDHDASRSRARILEKQFAVEDAKESLASAYMKGEL